MNKTTIFRGFCLLTLVTLVSSLWLLNPTPAAQAAFGDRITISNKQFMAGGNRIWINGANTPWNAWNDFGGSYNATWWSDHFQALHDKGVNATRVWITCSGEVGINISDAGYVSGATDKHWQDLDSFFAIAQEKQIYIMATLISFDHFKNTYTTYTKWRNWVQSTSNIDSYVTNYLIPFVNRYEANPYLWSIDLINEPDWTVESNDWGNTWDNMQQYWARAAKAIHENSPILVTVGMAMPKYNSSCANGCEGNKIADSALQAKVNDSDVYIDFYSSHYYPWMDPYFGGIPFYSSPTTYYGSDPGKPSLIGETPATGSTGHTLTQDYENGYLNGWEGVMPWTSNGVDSNGGFAEVTAATSAFLANHASLVFPSGATPTPTPTGTLPTKTPTRTNTATNTSLPGSCKVTYTKNQWGGGFTADVKITNNSATAINGWTLTWSFANGQQVTSAWNATVTQSGVNVSAVNVGYNGALAANGGTASFGFQATYSGTNADPTNFTLNGTACNATDVTPSATPTRTNTSVTPTFTPTRTNTSVTPTRTPTRTNTGTTPTFTPTRTNTSTTPTFTPTHTNTPGTPTTGCKVTYTVNQWSTGFTADVKITNNSTAAISGWTLTWSFANGQQITGSWNATVTQSGAAVTASNPAGHWNGTIAANGGSASFGFQATHTGTNATPTDFALNGTVCQ